MRDEDALSLAVVTALAAHEGVDPTRLEPPLYDVIDPDALDELFTGFEGNPSEPPAVVTFRYGDCVVEVTSDGSVAIQDASD
ncbi:HalOD1 output domain-containing protein [Haloarculaceae archaeon H-GB2-1]|nr:HalOD1 output domain-containing protein [Haloarculaceae archaeon H-GB11]MEA5409971.1 HalOD1 output domain-containing protein [Haloarculaceae archaeon H-GB2-1]